MRILFKDSTKPYSKLNGKLMIRKPDVLILKNKNKNKNK